MISLWQRLTSYNPTLRESAEALDGSNNTRPAPKLLTRLLEDIEYAAQHGPPFSLGDLPAYVDAFKNVSGVGLDDRKFLLEKLLVLMSRLPPDSEFSRRLQQFVIDILYKDLAHPNVSQLRLPIAASVSPTPNSLNYAHRTADGSDYNQFFPSMGKAGTPYARSVPSLSTNSISRLPDPGVVFDSLLERKDFVPHPGGISSLFFAFANLIIHSIFKTNHSDWTINDASSYLDLSILYGNSEQQVDSVRRKDGHGKLWEDVFADNRVLFMPPSVCALLVIFNRNHNYIADKILKINEKGTFVNPPQDSADLKLQDDEIFHRARLVNCGFFMQVILRDYVGAILGLVRDGFSWRLDPLQFARELDHEVSPRGEGGAVSIEFNLLYRWHAALSSHDTQWTEELFKKLFKEKAFNEVTPDDFQRAAHENMIPDPDLKTWTFGGLSRDSSGRFSDGALASLIQGATESSASAFKARGIPSVLRVIEIMGIQQARSWGTCTLNEFRKFIGLKPYATFAEWNPDPEIHSAALALYQHIDNLELHVGMQAEETKPPIPGAGLCPGYTISRAILSDAVSLTRGDRFLTVDFTPFNLTAWGYKDCEADVNDGSFGGVLSKLLFRHLPDFYPAGSAYGHFPFMVPEKMKAYLAQQPNACVDDYTWTRPKNSDHLSSRIRASKVTNVQTIEIKHIVFNRENVERYCSSFQSITARLIKEKSSQLEITGSKINYVDIVRDVINLIPVYWIAEEIIFLDLKSGVSSSEVCRDQEACKLFASAAEYLGGSIDPCNNWRLRIDSVRAYKLVRKAVVESLDEDSGWLSIFHFQRKDQETILQKLSSSTNSPPEVIAASVFAEIVATAAVYSKAVTQVVDHFLTEDSTKSAGPDETNLDARILTHVRNASLDHGNLDTSQNHGMMSTEFFEKTVVQVLHVILGLPGIGRVPGKSSQLGSFSNQTSRETTQEAYIGADGRITPWPVSMMLQYGQASNKSPII